MEISVKNLRVLITAAASGIGCAVAKTFLDNEARVYVCDINEDQLNACTTSLPGAGITQANVADATQIDRLFEETTAYLGGLDVLVNNAGIARPTAAVEDVSTEIATCEPAMVVSSVSFTVID